MLDGADPKPQPVARSPRSPAGPHPGHELTERQRQILHYAELGHSNKLIAHLLGLAPSTVSTLLHRALKRARSLPPISALGSLVSDRLVYRVTPPAEPPTLTEAEGSVVELVLLGLSNDAIATRRRCSSRTVANQLSAAYRKLGVSGRRELRAKAGR
jgi:DNA-binding CsgD family transcriptional regulator